MDTKNDAREIGLDDKTLYAFVDGSYLPLEDGTYGAGWGARLERYAADGALAWSRDHAEHLDPSEAGEHNIAGEILSATWAIEQALVLRGLGEDIERLVIVHDYEGTGHFAKGEWKIKSDALGNKRALRDLYRRASEALPIEFEWVESHKPENAAGADERLRWLRHGNNLVDALAQGASHGVEVDSAAR